jgi:hypothetical protein
MKNLPLGRQNFEDIINENLLYVDKTKQVYDLVNRGNLYFLSRPRRFGKSLLVSLLGHFFSGKKELFDNLYIGKQTDYAFEEFPVLQFNFAAYGHQVDDLKDKLTREIHGYAEKFEIALEPTSLEEDFGNLIKGIAAKGKPVVLLIDEYDKPIIDFFTEYEKAKVNQKVLRDFFSPLKNLESKGHLRFLFITGVSKFSKVSLFSDLNNLTDLSNSSNTNDLVGITQQELESSFEEHIGKGIELLNVTKDELLTAIKKWYNGYSFDGEIRLYNPHSLLNFFNNCRFDNYWFETGTPTFLVEAIRNEGINPKDLENIEVSNTFFAKFSLEHLDIIGLLYQTGYLTIKKIDRGIYETFYFLGYPNLEVQRSLEHNLVEAFTYKSSSTVSNALVKMQRGLKSGNVNLFMDFLQIILSDLKYNWQPPKQYKNETELFKMWEGYFHAIIYVITSYMNISVKAEVTTNKGRVDLISETADFIYFMEFKLDKSAAEAVEQIKNQQYAMSYKNSPKTIFLVGVNFSKEERNIESWESEVLERDFLK